MRRGREAGVVAEHAGGAALVPSLAELLDHRLQRGRNRLVLGVTVRNESVVGGHANLSTPRLAED